MKWNCRHFANHISQWIVLKEISRVVIQISRGGGGGGGGGGGEGVLLGMQLIHCNDIITTTMASQFTSLTVVDSTVYSDTDQRKHQGSASLAFVWGIHRDRWISPHKGPVTRKMFPFDDVIMNYPSLAKTFLLWYWPFDRGTKTQ